MRYRPADERALSAESRTTHTFKTPGAPLLGHMHAVSLRISSLPRRVPLDSLKTKQLTRRACGAMHTPPCACEPIFPLKSLRVLPVLAGAGYRARAVLRERRWRRVDGRGLTSLKGLSAILGKERTARKRGDDRGG